MFLSASKIHYLVAEKDMLESSESVTADILAVSRKLAAGHADYPKVQVVEKDGRWFTLNNAQLCLYQQLEHEGRGRQVKVHVVPLNDVPQEVRRMMVVPLSSTDEDSSRSTAKGYSELGQRDVADDKEKDDSDSDAADSEDSELDDTDSEFDWSDEERDSSDSDDSEADGDPEKRSDDERESLL